MAEGACAFVDVVVIAVSWAVRGADIKQAFSPASHLASRVQIANDSSPAFSKEGRRKGEEEEEEEEEEVGEKKSFKEGKIA